MNDAKIAEWIDKLFTAAQSIGAKGAQLWPQLVGITFYTSLFWAFFHLLIAVAMAFIVIKVRKALFDLVKVTEDEDRALEKRYFVFQAGPYAACRFGIELGAWILGTLLVLLALSGLSGDLPGIFYPEAKTVLDLVAKMKS